MNIINNKRIIDIDCTKYNKETLFLGYSSDINSVELHFILEPELLEKTENNFVYKIVFNRGIINETVKDDVTWDAINGLTYTVPPAITHFSNTDAIQGHMGYLQLFVMKGGDSSAATLVASSQKIPYIVADSLDLSATTVEDLGNTLWNAVQQAVAKIESLHFDTTVLTDNNSYIPTSKLVKNLLDGKANIADISNKADKATSLSGYGITDAYTKTEINTALSGKADTADIPELINDLLDGVTAIRQKVSLDSPPPEDELPASQILALPCIWYYNGDAWLIYDTEPGETAGYRKYKMIQFATDDDIPDISGKMDLAPTVTPSTIGTLPSGQICFLTGGVAIKSGSNTIELERTSKKTTSIDASSSNSQYPSAKAVYDLVSEIDISSAIKCYIGETEPSTQPIHASQMVSIPCIWYYNGSAWYIYDKKGTGTAGYYTYEMVKLAMYDDLPDLSTKEDKSNKVEHVQNSLSTTQYPSIKAMTTYVTLGLSYKEATANRVTAINSSSDNSHYPTAKAVKDYVDAAIAAAIQQLS